MKRINQYITEKLKITKSNIKNIKKTIVAEDFKHLHNIIENEINKNGVHCSLNHIDISNIDNISYCFYNIRNFNGDISDWDVSNVRDMRWMFARCETFNNDISKWKINRKCVTDSMFLGSSLDKKYRP